MDVSAHGQRAPGTRAGQFTKSFNLLRDNYPVHCVRESTANMAAQCHPLSVVSTSSLIGVMDK